MIRKLHNALAASWMQTSESDHEASARVPAPLRFRGKKSTQVETASDIHYRSVSDALR
jgi:hypothetical protein